MCKSYFNLSRLICYNTKNTSQNKSVWSNKENKQEESIITVIPPMMIHLHIYIILAKTLKNKLDIAIIFCFIFLFLQ